MCLTHRANELSQSLYGPWQGIPMRSSLERSRAFKVGVVHISVKWLDLGSSIETDKRCCPALDRSQDYDENSKLGTDAAETPADAGVLS